MKKLLIGLLSLTSISSFASETRCSNINRLELKPYSAINIIFSDSNTAKVEYIESTSGFLSLNDEKTINLESAGGFTFGKESGVILRKDELTNKVTAKLEGVNGGNPISLDCK